MYSCWCLCIYDHDCDRLCSPLLLRTIYLSKLINVLFSVYPIAKPVPNTTVGHWQSSYGTILCFVHLKIGTESEKYLVNASRTATACSIVLWSVSKQYYQCLQSDLFLSFFVVFPCQACPVSSAVSTPPPVLELRWR